MKLINLKVFNWGLFKSAEFSPDSVNCIKGINKDNPKESGNASGKSSLFKLAIVFLIYGEGYGKKLERLMRFGTKKTIVEGEIEHEGITYKIKRTIPNSLELYVNGIKQDYNTASICQNQINKIFGDYDYFKKYCLIDDKGINLLDSLKDVRSITTLKKELMQFIDYQFSPIRESLLQQKNNCELYSLDKRPYKYSLSKKRLSILENGLKNLNQILETTDIDKKAQQESINKISVKINQIEDKIILLDAGKDEKTEQILLNEDKIKNIKENIDSLQKKVFEIPIVIDYDKQINEISLKIHEYESQQKVQVHYLKKANEELQNIAGTYSEIITNIKNIKNDIEKYTIENQEINLANSGKRCLHCGALVTEENKNLFIKENEERIVTKNKELQEKNLELDKLTFLKIQQKKEIENIQIKINILDNNLMPLREELNQLHTKKLEQIETIKTIENQRNSKDLQLKQWAEQITNLDKQNETHYQNQINSEKQIESLNKELPVLREEKKQEEDCLNYYNTLYETTNKHIEKIKELIMKLSEAFKFSDYKYSESDVQLYTDSIKSLDEFSGYYIQEWLTNLTYIINDLLKNVNQSIELTDTKEFIKMKDNDQELFYSDLSSGQQTFLSAIFKLAILLQKGDSNRIIIADDGFGALDEVNFKNFIEICKTIPMQFFLVFQDVPIIENINYINIIRKNNESTIV